MFCLPQRDLCDMKQSSQQRIHQKEKEAQELRQAIFTLTVSNNSTPVWPDTQHCSLMHTYRGPRELRCNTDIPLSLIIFT